MRLPNETIQAVERRAFDVRRPMGDVCVIAGIHATSWSRAKSKGRIRIQTLAKIEDALTYLEGQKATGTDG